jgi:N-carbamoyl-L-amino-acid hydrolase
MDINIQRLETDLLELAAIGRSDDGITRQAFSKQDMLARNWLIEKMNREDLLVNTDNAGNISGIFCSNLKTQIVACGSHIDTVKSAGYLDGTLGVLAGLEALRCMKKKNLELAHPIEVISFSDEEGRFGNMFGSRVLTGLINQEEIYKAIDIEGNTLLDCMSACGLDTRSILEAKQTPDNYKAYVELHIEQGPILESENHSIGIVSGIAGLFKWMITITGQANHAGTTPMHLRKDALQGMVQIANQIPATLDKFGGSESRATIGKVDVQPGSPNVIPGVCEFSLEVRDTCQQTLNNIELGFKDLIENVKEASGLDIKIQPLSSLKCTPCSTDIVKLMTSIASQNNISHKLMTSGAAHDAQNMAAITDIGMIFVPSIKGISHNPNEATHIDDIEAGANMLLKTLVALGTGS